MIDDLLKSAKETIVERMTSPLLGSFAVAWCLWNYKFLVILFSENGVSQTFKLIESIAFPDLWSVFNRGVLFPLISALVYVFAYPYPARFIYAFTLKRQREVNQIKRQIEEETLLTLEQSREIRLEYAQIEQKHRAEIDRLASENARLKAIPSALKIPDPIVSARRQAAQSQRNVTSDVDNFKLEQTQLALLEYLDSKNGRAYRIEFLKNSKETRVKTEFDLGELHRIGLIAQNYESEDYVYEFTHEGRRALLEARATQKLGLLIQ
jgi:hypothetical protein